MERVVVYYEFDTVASGLSTYPNLEFALRSIAQSDDIVFAAFLSVVDLIHVVTPIHGDTTPDRVRRASKTIDDNASLFRDSIEAARSEA